MRILLMLGIAYSLHASAAVAETIFQYDANSFFTDPYFQGWYPTGGSGVEVVDQGQTAWQTSTNQARYHRTIDPEDMQSGLRNGWRFKAEARLVGGLAGASGAGASGLAVYVDNKGYPILFALDTSGALNAKEIDLSVPLSLTPANMGTAAYHDIELRWEPTRQKVEFWFDGEYRRDINGFAAIGHEPLARFGQINLATTSMNFRNVTFEVGPYVTLPKLLGDYNLDGIVNASDYTMWRNTLGMTVDPYVGADGDGNGMVTRDDYLVWRRSYGEHAAAALEAAPLAVPEPTATGVLAFAALVGLGRCRRTSP